MLKKKTFLKLKVHLNKTTGQGAVFLPKKKFKVLPKEVKIKKW